MWNAVRVRGGRPMGIALRGGVAIWIAAAAVLAPAASSRAATLLSSNWAGYVALAPASVGSRFSSAAATWSEPTAHCVAGREAYSAAWVGLGGYSENAPGLEQIGTDADCSPAGRAVYSSWYELLPAGPVNLTLRVHAGDRLSASVAVRGRTVTLAIRDLSTGARRVLVRRTAHIDVSSADWIVEAPSACPTNNSCRALALADFGQVAFSSARASAGGQSGPLTGPPWSPMAMELSQSAHDFGGRRAGANPSAAGAEIVASTSAPTGPSGAFSVSWRELSVQGEPPSAPPLPGFNGGPP